MIVVSANLITRDDSHSRGTDMMYVIFSSDGSPSSLIVILNHKDFWVKYFSLELKKHSVLVCSINFDSMCFIFLVIGTPILG